VFQGVSKNSTQFKLVCDKCDMTQTANKYNWTNDACAWHWEIKQGLV